MIYDGLEIDMLSLGDADSILVTRWINGSSNRVLIDGGNVGSASTVQAFLKKRGIYYIEEVVCSHPHDDHAGGLVEILSDQELQFGRLWMHLPDQHVDMARMCRVLFNCAGIEAAASFTRSLKTIGDLRAVAQARGIPIAEPFSGNAVGCLTVCGPSVEFYEEMLRGFADADKLRGYDAAHTHAPLAELLLRRSTSSDDSDSRLDNPQTSPENNSSTILATVFADEKHLLTADAGAQGLVLAGEAYDLANCSWMQIPHHGSRRNITESLIKHFSASVAFVSATGNSKHPRRAVINAFKRHGATVYSTHYPSGGHLWHHRGTVPERSDYSSATPLWEAKKCQKIPV